MNYKTRIVKVQNSTLQSTESAYLKSIPEIFRSFHLTEAIPDRAYIRRIRTIRDGRIYPDFEEIRLTHLFYFFLSFSP